MLCILGIVSKFLRNQPTTKAQKMLKRAGIDSALSQTGWKKP